jgi:hypothetical protein
MFVFFKCTLKDGFFLPDVTYFEKKNFGPLLGQTKPNPA